mmetsp:Transcript_10002/g.14733  ORF Transcript_10002/g.14733 Transcript_10002/m.14733 type:complete len:298 (+) Transcript_10002:67-960(+)
MVASWKGYEDIVKYLLKLRCDSSIEDATGRTALHLAYANNNYSIVNLLLKKSNYTTMEETIKCERKSTIKEITRYAKLGRLLWVKKAIERYASRFPSENSSIINEMDHLGRSPLFLATSMGHTPIVEYLLSLENINPNQKHDFNQKTPLHEAALKDHLEIAELLLKHPHIDIELEDEDYKKPIDYCCSLPMKELFEKDTLEQFHEDEDDLLSTNHEDDLLSTKQEDDLFSTKQEDDLISTNQEDDLSTNFEEEALSTNLDLEQQSMSSTRSENKEDDNKQMFQFDDDDLLDMDEFNF